MGDGTSTATDLAQAMFADGVRIVDPTRVVRIALETLYRWASVLLLTEAVMTELPEPKRNDAATGQAVL